MTISIAHGWLLACMGILAWTLVVLALAAATVFTVRRVVKSKIRPRNRSTRPRAVEEPESIGPYAGFSESQMALVETPPASRDFRVKPVRRTKRPAPEILPEEASPPAPVESGQEEAPAEPICPPGIEEVILAGMRKFGLSAMSLPPEIGDLVVAQGAGESSKIEVAPQEDATPLDLGLDGPPPLEAGDPGPEFRDHPMPQAPAPALGIKF